MLYHFSVSLQPNPFISLLPPIIKKHFAYHHLTLANYAVAAGPIDSRLARRHDLIKRSISFSIDPQHKIVVAVIAPQCLCIRPRRLVQPMLIKSKSNQIS